MIYKLEKFFWCEKNLCQDLSLEFKTVGLCFKSSKRQIFLPKLHFNLDVIQYWERSIFFHMMMLRSAFQDIKANHTYVWLSIPTKQTRLKCLKLSQNSVTLAIHNQKTYQLHSERLYNNSWDFFFVLRHCLVVSSILKNKKKFHFFQ